MAFIRLLWDVKVYFLPGEEIDL